MRRPQALIAAFAAVLGMVALFALLSTPRSPEPEKPTERDAATADARETKPSSPLPTATTTRAPPPELLEKLAQARELALELDPLAETTFDELAVAARDAGFAELERTAKDELARFHESARKAELEVAGWTRDEARALARDHSPAAVPWFASALAAARRGRDEALAKALAAELEACRADIERRATEALLDQRRGPREPTPESREDQALLDGIRSPGDETAWRALLEHAAKLHAAHACERVASLLERARASVGPVPIEGLARFELGCRLEACGRAVRRGDGPRALAFVDLAELTKLDATASHDRHVLYLLGRAFEADGRPDEARKVYLAAIGTVAGIAPGMPVDLLRYLARCAVLSEAISLDMPGLGPQWRRIERPSFTLFTEVQGSVRAAATKVEESRKRAIARLGFGDARGLHGAKILVFLYASPERYAAVAIRPWAVGHASFNQLEDGGSGAIVTSAGVTDEIVDHELAHVLVADHLRGERIPDWMNEGAAMWAEPEAAREALLADARAAKGQFHPWLGFFASASDARYFGSDSTAARLFYLQSLVTFSAAVRGAGSPWNVLILPSERRRLTREELQKVYAWLEPKPFEKLVAEVLKEPSR